MTQRSTTNSLENTPHALPPGSTELPEQMDVVIEGGGRHSGFAIAPACIIRISVDKVPLQTVDPSAVEAEIQRLHDASRVLRGELESMARSHTEDTSHALFGLADSLRYLNDNDELLTATVEAIRQHRYSAEYAVQQTFDLFARALDTEFTHDRAFEPQDIASSLIRVLNPKSTDIVQQFRAQLERMSGPKIVVTRDLSPAQALQLSDQNVRGLIVGNYGALGHQAMIVQDLQIPVIGDQDLTENDALQTGDEIIVDGDRGLITIHPSAETAGAARARMALFHTAGEAVSLKEHAPVTRDGVRIELSGDLRSPNQMSEFLDRRVNRIGLVRTEFSYLKANNWPSEEQQVAELKEILHGASPHSVSLRTFDFGGDKTSPGLGTQDANDVGLRGIRYALSIREKEFTTQLRAMIIAATEVGNDCRIIFPMVLDAGDMKKARAVYNTAVSELISERRIARAPNNISLGAMIETSSAVELIGPILRECDFVSIGTRDLLVSTLDGDLNKAVGAHYHPAILSCMQRVLTAARQAEKPAYVCGEMPAQVRNIPLLIGLGADKFVVPYDQIEAVNGKIARCDSAACRTLVQAIIDSGDGDEALGLLEQFLEAVRIQD